MTSEQTGEAKNKAKRTGPPKGSKNKKKRSTQKRLGRPPGSKSKKAVITGKNSSLENTIKQLLKLPTSAEAKVRLIEAALDI